MVTPLACDFIFESILLFFSLKSNGDRSVTAIKKAVYARLFKIGW
jgi:hypothetical protein